MYESERDGVREKEKKRDERTSALTQPELIIQVPEASGVVLPVPEKFQLSVLASEENLRIDFYECRSSFTIFITSTAEINVAQSVIRITGTA